MRLNRRLALAYRSRPWTPRRLPKVYEWWSAGDGLALRTGTSYVEAWRGRLQRLALAQATESQQPQWLAADAEVGGHPTVDVPNPAYGSIGLKVEFDAPLPQPWTVLVVYADWVNTVATTDGLFDGFNLTCKLQGQSTVNVIVNESATLVHLGQFSNWLGTHAVAVIADGASTDVYRDGGADLCAGDAGSNALDGLTLGNIKEMVRGSDVRIAEVVVVAGRTSVRDLNQWGRYVERRYGITWTEVA